MDAGADPGFGPGAPTKTLKDLPQPEDSQEKERKAKTKKIFGIFCAESCVKNAPPLPHPLPGLVAGMIKLFIYGFVFFKYQVIVKWLYFKYTPKYKKLVKIKRASVFIR